MADLPRESGRVELVSDRIKLGSRRICRGSGRLGDAPLPKLRISPCRRQPEGAATRGADVARRRLSGSKGSELIDTVLLIQ